MSEITTIGLDLAKHVFQVHGIDAEGTTVLRKRLRRGQVLAFFSRIPRCVVGLEACATAHYWGRELGALGHEVRLMPAQYVKAYIKRNKHDAADAEAICEAVQRPTMRFVPVKTTEQQATALLHRGREQLVRQRTMLVNALRAHLAEFGMVAAQGLRNVGELIAIVRDDGDTRLPDVARQVLQVLADQIEQIETAVAGLERQLLAWWTTVESTCNVLSVRKSKYGGHRLLAICEGDEGSRDMPNRVEVRWWLGTNNTRLQTIHGYEPP
jgi:transposase